jgi:hypothetical protein
MYATYLSDASTSLNMVQLLLAAGADKSISSDDGTACDIAFENGCDAQLCSLLKE